MDSVYADTTKLDEIYQANKLGINDKNVRKYIKNDLLKSDYDYDAVN